MHSRSKRTTHDFLIEGSRGFEWLCVLIIPRTKENWMIAELDRYLDGVLIDNMWTQIVRGRSYCYLTVWAEMEEDASPDEIKQASGGLRRACAKARGALASVIGWCDFMSIREFALHDRQVAEECFGVRAVRKAIRPNPERSVSAEPDTGRVLNKPVSDHGDR